MRKLLGTIIVAVLVIYFVYQRFLIGMISGAVEQAVGAPVKIKSIHIRPVPLEVGIYGMKIMNLKGYKEPELISIPEIFVRVNPGALFKGVIEVEKVVLSMEHVTVEKTQAGKINLKEVLDHSKKEQKKTSAPSGPSQGPQAPSKKKGSLFKLKINETQVSLRKVAFVDYGSGQRVVRGFDMNINNFTLHDVTDMDSLTEEIVVMILKKVGAFALGVGADRLVSNIQQEAGQLFASAKSKLSKAFA